MKTHSRLLAWVTVGCLAVAVPASAQSARTLYDRALARETAARKQTAPSVTTLRAIATSFETLVRRHPSSGYADNALWHGALVLDLAFDRSGQVRDRNEAARLLRWLAKEYPHGALAKQATARLTASPPAARPATVTASTPRAIPPLLPAATVTTSPVDTPLAPTAGGPAPAAPGANTPAISLTALAFSSLPKGDRLTLELSRESAYVMERLNGSHELKFSLAGVVLTAEALDAAARVRGLLVQAVRLTTRNGTTEVVLQLSGQPRHSSFPLYEPYRLVIDVEADAGAVSGPPSNTAVPFVAKTVTPPNSITAAAPLPGATGRVSTTPPAKVDAAAPPAPPSPQPAASTARGGYSLARQLGLGVSRIVIDPGHGGHDPGAKAHGISEADVVLDVALRLEKLLLDQPGFEVVLTRRTNEFIALEERTALANREGADLFLSIHANSSPRSDTRGVETYVLNFATNDHAEAVAARENAATAKSMRLLPDLVKAIANNNKVAESRELASMVQQALLRQLRQQNRTVQDLGVKQAPFVVLIGAAMPSVLAEISFVTNRTDAGQLKTTSYRQRIAQALADAVLRYQGSFRKAAAVAAAEGR